MATASPFPITRARRALRALLPLAAVTFLTVALFDLAAYRLLPDRYLLAFERYRRPPRPSEPGLAGWPRNYYVANETRGFDIGEKRSTRHWVDGVTYPIWSNSLGCFDEEHDSYADAVYFAGDSFTWGFTPFEEKFGTLVERESGTTVLKCGVTHTGQRHQFDKFVEIVARTASRPRAVFVFFFENDVADDYAHPHSTVIDGWLVDTVVTYGRSELVRRSPQELSKQLEAELDELRQEEQSSRRDVALRYRFATVLLRYSLTANLWRAVRTATSSTPGERAPKHGDRGSSKPRSFYAIPPESQGRFSYLENRFARENQAALLAFAAWTAERGVPLVVVLVPRQRVSFDPDWYAEVHEFLDRHRIRFTDLARNFRARDLDPGELYWRGNAHFNPRGNEEVARALLDEFPEIFARERPQPGR